ncbi:hypothetical protein BJY52DRAFT_1123483 [Lactarius psammicola]|nr:hypothetical protein BJY52DRAFT_1123483 [Lactarius psammicola]
MAISLPTAQLVALCLSTLLYGMFFALVLITTVVMLYGATEDVRRQRMKILPVSYAMLLVATLHFVVGWIRAVYAFVDHKRGSTIIFYSDISEPTSLLRSTCFCVQSIMGDGIVIWRLYIVYGKRFRVIIPAIILVIGYTVVGIAILAISIRARPGTDIFHVATTWITAYFSLTMATNAYTRLGAITLRIFLAGNPLRGSRPHWLIIFTLIESCALYTFSVIAALTTFLSGTFGQYAAADSIVPMIGIAFSLIVLQIRFHVSATQGPSHSSGPMWPQPGSRPAGGEDPNYFRMAVHVSKQAHVPHVVGKDIYDSSLDMDKPMPTAV